MNMTEDRCTSQVRQRAYAIWEQDGRRHGNDWAHWFQSEAELRAELARNRVYEELWAGVGRRISNARSSLAEMVHSLQNDPRAEARAIAAGVPVGMPTGWEESFYAALDAFVTTARSVPEVINCCFGHDRSAQMRDWFSGRPPAEKARRQTFSTNFRDDFEGFRTLDLSNERDVTVHRRGYPDVVITITGRWGEYTGTPISRLPMVESEPPIVRDTDALKWAATQPPNPIRVTPNDFTIRGKPLFDECRLYFEAAENLVVKGRAIAAAVHGTDPITPPPA
jgi:Protein of unknown function (DUF2934)